SHASTLKSPSYTKSVSWQHYPLLLFLENASQKQNSMQKSAFFK
ncbi:transposase, partial [Escherichia coli]